VASLLQLRHVCRFWCRCFDGPEGENGVDRQDAGSHRDAEGSGWKVFASNLDIRHHPTSSDIIRHHPTKRTTHIDNYQYMIIMQKSHDIA
jgi:hypothetical protein